MILELCTGGELVARIMDMPNGISEGEAARHVKTMLSALHHCHEHGVVHRDVKLDNFVYEHDGRDAQLKLIDFGLSHLGDTAARGRVGTLSCAHLPASPCAPPHLPAPHSLGCCAR